MMAGLPWDNRATPFGNGPNGVGGPVPSPLTVLVQPLPMRGELESSCRSHTTRGATRERPMRLEGRGQIVHGFVHHVRTPRDLAQAGCPAGAAAAAGRVLRELELGQLELDQ